MRGVFDPRQLGHAPVSELHNGEMMPYSESAARAEAIAAVLGPLEPATDHGEGPLAAVHDRAYLDFLKSAHARWLQAGRTGDAIAYTFPPGLMLRAGAGRVLTCRNVGQATTFSAGLLYTLPFPPGGKP